MVCTSALEGTNPHALGALGRMSRMRGPPFSPGYGYGVKKDEIQILSPTGKHSTFAT